MYHAESFAKLGFDTYLVGYRGSKPIPGLLSLPRVHFSYLPTPPSKVGRLPFIIVAPFKVVRQTLTILITLLWRLPHVPEFIMVQNPPSIPTLALVWLFARIRGSKIIIDWHNTGYSILALRLGDEHILVKLARAFEAYFGRSAYAHLFVTRAMRTALVEEWHLQGLGAVLHDRPPSYFHRCTPSEVHELFLRLSPSLPQKFLPEYSTPYSTPFTHISNHTQSSSSRPAILEQLSMPSLRSDRPAIVVSSTSWTPDEDFSILLKALTLYEKQAREINRPPSVKGRLPKLLMIVTGKGPLRSKYMNEVQRLQNGDEGNEPWEWVQCISLWLEAQDYPLLLGSADLGISLHSSSSNMDLPMKVVDMFGCGLPVCALDFACLSELVKDGTNGLVFNSAEQLAKQLETLLLSFPASKALDNLRSSLRRASKASITSHELSSVGEELDSDWEWNSWDDNWAKVVKPLVLSDVQAGHAAEYTLR
ncbi:beta-1,4-mannosyltransferase [Stereum hirsutum FP-91666 SS1]|uniref:beta-1,4-mannosyltransferase n=1 Tax=Stereum hirsutum (strain FP-91666) TaxID=721885 RepID=UPI000440AE6F|nr:beta-1,4-mannosyltransferase [Stereum hirsutum FP-91666 SS1]EIM92116.1 beta-1,4-mannosyltransferase [Stereum hirsutum FP-91666 SS1]